ncbi:MAG: alkylhydroperoxidase [Bacteroidetes bacterium]|nr:MAG: alkylhydroperoxidase [Bacteroidota bacterium]PIE87797.1 MAG: alkylhydroperoxidase [Bacteroidota bacterium]
MNTSLSKSVLQENRHKRKFNLKELYTSFVFAPRALSKLIKNKRHKFIDPRFVERLQLAVTEVNGCAACSYQHTKMALQKGLHQEEISSLLSGGEEFIKPEEAKAILFVQHFADSRGTPQKYTYEAIEKEYGTQKAQIILSAAQIMIAGNMYGIPLSAFLARLQGKPYQNSPLSYELTMLILGALCLPIAIIHGYIRGFIGLPNKRFHPA